MREFGSSARSLQQDRNLRSLPAELSVPQFGQVSASSLRLGELTYVIVSLSQDAGSCATDRPADRSTDRPTFFGDVNVSACSGLVFHLECLRGEESAAEPNLPRQGR